MDVLKFLVLLIPQRVVAGMADVPARSCPRGQREGLLNAQEAEVVQAEAMPAAMIERCSCGDRSDMGSLALEPHLPAAEREDDQDRQGKAAEYPEQAGDNTDQDVVAGGGLPHGVGEVSHCGVEGGGCDRVRGGRRRGEADIIGVGDAPQAHDGDDCSEEQRRGSHR